MYKQALDRWLSTTDFSTGLIIRFWDGTSKTYGPNPRFTVTLKKASVIPELVKNISMGFGEAYMRGDIDIEGSMIDAVELFHGTDIKESALSFGAKLTRGLMNLKQNNKLGQAAKNIQHHYDVGQDFYALWLGEEMVYSCAYFKNAHESIDVAQSDKLDYICKKLFLKPGETMLDIGCGWGGLVMHAAKTYGVTAHGITLSKDQLAYATKQVKEEGLEGKVMIELIDYRELIRRGMTFDKVASIGMFEHVGLDHQQEYFDATNQLMKPGAIALLHTIGKMRGAMVDPWIQKYIFPGAYLPAIGEVTTSMKKFAFRITDIENLRLHYALTLDRWLEAFEKNVDKVHALYGESFVRMWRLYLAGSSAGFRYGDLDLWQIQFTKGIRNDLPMTRDYLYQ
ncbi:class I SAM-dependent methyltransferase [Candidatus Uhrbacteria bacterium]|nr:class I SAM-dependent methyltransferase [Candidatus Uhrbacteria bacterium]